VTVAVISVPTRRIVLVSAVIFLTVSGTAYDPDHYETETSG